MGSTDYVSETDAGSNLPKAVRRAGTGMYVLVREDSERRATKSCAVAAT
jgi:hypothetical protein